MRIVGTIIAACSFIGIACSASAAPVSTDPAFAAPAPTSTSARYDHGSTLEETARLHTVHGCHFDMGPNMEPDRANGPHYHDNQCRVIRTGPPRGQYRQREYDDPPRRQQRGYEGYDDRPRRRARESGYYAPPPPPPVCREECRYRGPFKSCKTVCQ